MSRTDALAAIGLEEALERMEEAREAGADASFVEAPGSIEYLEKIGRSAPKPMVANMIEGGKTPILERSRLEDMGFQLILYPLAGIFAAAQAMHSVFRKLKDDQTTLGAEEQLFYFERFNQLVGVEEKFALAERFGAE